MVSRQLYHVVIDLVAFLALGLACALAVGSEQLSTLNPQPSTLDPRPSLCQCPGGCCGPNCSPCPGGACPVRPPAPGPQPPAQPLPARCRINVDEGRGATSKGSGTLVVCDRLVLTCAHLFDDGARSIACGFPDGRTFSGRLVAIDKASDLAAIEIPATGIQPLAVDTRPPSGQLAAGSFGPPAAGFVAVFGQITRWAKPAGARHPCAIMQGRVRQGDSGGGVVNSERILVGVVWGCNQEGTHFTCGQALAEFMARVEGLGFRVQGSAPAPPSTPPAPSPLPPATPPPIAAAPACRCEATIAALRAELAAMKQQLAANKPCQCEPGAMEQHRAAVEARLAALEQRPPSVYQAPATQPINYDELAAEVARRLPPIHFRVEDNRGPQFSTEYQSAHLGSYVTLPFGPN